MNAINNRCVGCDDVITNPVCSDCLATQMAVMVGEYDPDLARHISGVKIQGDTFCIQCGQKMGLCAHCFSLDIYHFLRERNERLGKEFLQRFDFELRKEVA
ncbi:MAG TPA: hypothetical protein VJH68_03915 [Candidatus Nanoarchaeia archaeon]|nr:hypothetical protein [Candidatus Nanoarchaeia archaeon]